MFDKNYAMSSYLAFRFLIESSGKEIGFSPSLIPLLPAHNPQKIVPVKNTADLDAALQTYLKKGISPDTGILLSGGMDSAILASYLPKGTKAYTIRFVAPGAVNEADMASLYAKLYHLEHHVVEVYWEDYIQYAPGLMEYKKAPLHAIEVALYKAALRAKKDGVKQLVVGNGADSNFGGLDKLLSKDWGYTEFIDRYTFCRPEAILKFPCDITPVYALYRTLEGIDVQNFLSGVHGVGVIQAFENALSLAGVGILEPFESISLAAPLDIMRIRSGESKYLIRELFTLRFPGVSIPDKIPFARPMDQWLETWEGPQRPEFFPSCAKGLGGDQKWLVYCLEWFLNINNL